MTQYEGMLKNFLSKYTNQNETKHEIISTVNQYRDLRPSFKPFVFNDGTQRQLVVLEGTIPVNYKGSTYNIPITLWILDTHPYNPPMVFVNPTSTMQIRPGKYVDANGKVDLPFLREWRHPTSDLLSLVQILTFTFGEECPVFSKTSSQRPAQNMTYPSQTPYPTNPGGMPMPGMPSSNPPYPQQVNRPNYPTQSYTPYPAPNSYPNPPANPSYPGYPPTATQGYPPSTVNNAPPYPGVAPPPSYPAPNSGFPPYPVPSVGNQNPNITPGGTVTEADIRASLLSAVEDKMKRKLKEIFEQAQAEMDVLSKTQTDLNNGKQKLENILVDLEKEKSDIERNMSLLSTKDNEVKEAIQKMENSENVDIDEAVVTTTPLYRQLVNAFAEEQAIEDAIYYLGEGLMKSVIELDVYLKKVRELSRKQFMLRATIQKCRDKAGLPAI